MGLLPRFEELCGDAAQQCLLAQRLTAVREDDDDVELLPKEAVELVLRLREAAGRKRRPLRVEAERLALRQLRHRRRTVGRDRIETLLFPRRLHLIGRPHDVRRTVECRHQVVRHVGRELLALVRAEVDLDQLAQTFACRIDRRAVDRAQRTLGERRERADLLDLVAEELDAKRFTPGRREDIDEPTTDCELPTLLDALDALVARGGEVPGEGVEAIVVADAHLQRRGPSGARRQAFGDRGSRSADEPSLLQHLERARTLAHEVRRRLETAAPVDTARREECDPVVAGEPRCSLCCVACVGILGQNDDQPAVELLVQRGEQQRQNGLRHARARRQRSCELLQALLGTEALDERVEYRLVHDVWPNCAFGGGVMVVAGPQTRRRAPSYRAEYQPESGSIATRVPV